MIRSTSSCVRPLGKLPVSPALYGESSRGSPGILPLGPGGGHRISSGPVRLADSVVLLAFTAHDSSHDLIKTVSIECASSAVSRRK